MSSAKKTEPVKAMLLGRATNNVSIGIVGMPNVGKSTIFNALSKLNVPAENFPFCTIDPNTAKVPVPDDRFDYLVSVYKPKSVKPAVLTITDIAGLVKGAHEGKGLGNAFLSHITAVDAIYHVCRAFADDLIEHVEGSVDPIRDLEIIVEELILKDLERVKAKMETMKRQVAHGGDKTKKFEYDTLQKVADYLEARKEVRFGEWNVKEVDILNEYQFLTAKPGVYLINIAEDDYKQQKNKWLKKVHEYVKAKDPSAKIIPFSAAFESKVNDLKSDEERKVFFEEQKVPSAMPKIILAGYHCLELIHYFTAGEDEVRAWTLRKGCLAPQAAGVIHSDFEKGFVCAEVMTFEDYKSLGSESAVKAAGKYRTQGKLYTVTDGDIMYFKHAPVASKK